MLQERSPELRTHQHDRKVAHLAGLDECECLEEFIDRAESARHHHEGVGVLHKHDLAHEEVREVDADVEIRIRHLLVREFDVAADGVAAGFLGAAVGRLHHPRPAAGHDREADPAEGRSHDTGEFVFGVAFADPGRAEHRDTRSDEVQATESPDHLAHHPRHRSQLATPQARATEERAIAVEW